MSPESPPSMDRLRAAYDEWLGEPAFTLSLRNHDPAVPPLEVLFVQPPDQQDLPEHEHVTYVVTGGMSARPQPAEPRAAELFMRVNAVVERAELEALGRALATLATVPWATGVALVPGLVLDDVSFPVFHGMTCALVTHWGVRHAKWLREHDSPVLVLNVIPLFPEEADAVHRIGDAEAFRQFRQAGVNWYAPSRPRVDLRVPEPPPPVPENEKTAMPAADENAPDPAAQTVWKKIEAWLQEHAPAMHGRLPAGASAESLDRLEKEIGVPLPPAYRSFLQRHDGGVPWRSHDLLSADEVLAEWKSNNELREQGTWNDADAETSDGRIAGTWWNKGWIPFARDSGGNLLLIDMAPGPKGQAGQILQWDTVDGPGTTEHASFQALAQQLRDDLAAGKYTATEDETLEFDWS